jgi:hypothetical protein
MVQVRHAIQNLSALTDLERCFGVQGHRLPISGVEWGHDIVTEHGVVLPI